MADTSSLEDNIFELLVAAKKLEDNGDNATEAATKYYEAVYLMRRFIQRLPWTAEEEPKRVLMQQKIQEFEERAQEILGTRKKDLPALATTSLNGSTKTNGSDPSGLPSKSMTGQQNRGIYLDAMVPGQAPTRLEPQSGFHSEDLNIILRLINQASTKLARALDLDESGQKSQAIQAYMEAAELYLQSLQRATENVERQQQQQHDNNNNCRQEAEFIPLIKRRLESTLDRVEHLKNPTMHKRAQSLQSPNHQKTNRQALTPEEVSILIASSTTVAGLYLPWSDEDAEILSKEAIRAGRSELNTTTPFKDPDGYLPLSLKQKDAFYKWARPDEIVRIRQRTGLTGKRLQKPVLFNVITPYSIKQRYITDCSFIASLCVTAAFERRFRKRLVTSTIYPQSPDSLPCYNSLGKYMVKLWLNGVARCVIVDDYLPIDKYGNLLCSHSSGTQSQFFELWVCLIEKAYIKMCGGYDFPGSNSGVDLFSLTGWIPERVHFSKSADKVRDFEMLPERAWERITGASSFGDCLITVSSHLSLSQAEADRLGLVMGHAYAVLSVIETSSGVRLLQLKNPWALKGWRGRYSPNDTESWKDSKLRAEVGYDPDKARGQDDGVFWICWDDILNYFLNFHLSWNPFLFSYRTTSHGMWPKDRGPYDDTFNVGENPQYILSLSDEAIRQKATIWILISRHVSKQEQEGADVSDYLTVHVHRNKGMRETIWYPGKSGNCVLTGAYTNNPHVLVRYDVTSGEDKNLSLVLSQYQKTNDLRYTLSVYSTESFVLAKPRPNLSCHLNRSGKLNPEGGPLGSKQVIRNPMYSLSITKENTALEVRVATAKNIPLNVVVLPVARAGHRLDQATGLPLIDSGKYRHGFLVTERTALKAGTYVLVVSCYTPGQEGIFDLRLMTSQPVEVLALQ